MRDGFAGPPIAPRFLPLAPAPAGANPSSTVAGVVGVVVAGVVVAGVVAERVERVVILGRTVFFSERAIAQVESFSSSSPSSL